MDEICLVRFFLSLCERFYTMIMLSVCIIKDIAVLSPVNLPIFEWLKDYGPVIRRFISPKTH